MVERSGGGMYYQLDENFLAHFGVPGMKWGHRKAQSSSGTLSKRKQKKLKKAEVKAALKKNKQDYRNAKNKADERYNKDVKEYKEAYGKVQDHFNKKQKTFQEKNNTRMIDYTIEEKRNDSLQALYAKYADTNAKAFSRRSASYRKAKNVYKNNKNKLVSSLKK